MGSPHTKMRLWLVVGAGLWCVSTPLSAQVAVLGAIVVDSTDVSGNHIVVTAVADASPASYAGVAVGDRIVGVARRPVHRTSEIEQLAREQAGPVLLMLIQRDSVVTEALVPLHASAAELASPPRRVARGCAVFCLATTVADQATWDDCGCERAVRRTCNGCVAGWTERVPLWVVRHGPGLGPYEWRVHIRDAWCGQ